MQSEQREVEVSVAEGEGLQEALEREIAPAPAPAPAPAQPEDGQPMEEVDPEQVPEEFQDEIPGAGAASFE